MAKKKQAPAQTKPPPHTSSPRRGERVNITITMANNMKGGHYIVISLALVVVSTSMRSVASFTAIQLNLSPTLNQPSSSCIFAEESASSNNQSDKLYATKSIQEGSHDELMYTLGVNLARQLGDVRPLVENSEELTHLARGLLDAIVGKLEDADQMKLLARRGEDLNNVILERA